MDLNKVFTFFSENIFVKRHLLPHRDGKLDLGSATTRWANVHANSVKVSTYLVLGPGTELTIAGGIVTATGTWHIVDTEGNAASDNLDTINGGVAGCLLLLNTANSGRDVTVKHATGNIHLASSADFAMASTAYRLLLSYTGSAWHEISRAANG